ncbi:MAG: peptidoglycan DD-metalloendopeptidase family protein, partial [Actinomycetota bacterium]
MRTYFRAFFRHPTTTALLAGVLFAAHPTAFAADVSTVQKELDTIAAQYGRLETALAATEARQNKLESDLQRADQIIAQKAELVRKRAGSLYKQGGVGGFLEKLIVAPDMGTFVKRLTYLEVLGDKDSKLVESLRITKGRADSLREDLAATRSRQVEVVKSLKAKRQELQAKFRGVQSAAKVKKFGKFEAFTLPVSPSAFANTWGARRSGGRRHKGTDVMAPCGAPVRAVASGSVQNLHSGGNGGIMAYIRAANGDVFFYAHLKRYAPGIRGG